MLVLGQRSDQDFALRTGMITLGTIDCAAVASEGYNMLAALVRRDRETLAELLARLDDAIEQALEEDIFIDEINS